MSVCLHCTAPRHRNALFAKLHLSFHPGPAGLGWTGLGWTGRCISIMDSSPPSLAQAATNLQYVHRGAAANLCIHLATLCALYPGAGAEAHLAEGGAGGRRGRGCEEAAAGRGGRGRGPGAGPGWASAVPAPASCHAVTRCH